MPLRCGFRVVRRGAKSASLALQTELRVTRPSLACKNFPSETGILVGIPIVSASCEMAWRLLHFQGEALAKNE